MTRKKDVIPYLRDLDLETHRLAYRGITAIISDTPDEQLSLAIDLCLKRVKAERIILFKNGSSPSTFKGNRKTGSAMGAGILREPGSEDYCYIVNVGNEWDSLSQISFLSSMAQRTLIVMLLPREPYVRDPSVYVRDMAWLSDHFLLKHANTLVCHASNEDYLIGITQGFHLGMPFKYVEDKSAAVIEKLLENSKTVKVV